MGRKVDVDELIDSSEVARILGLTHRNAVSLYLRRYEDMPRPVVVRSEGRFQLWVRADIAMWAKKTGRNK